MSCRRQRLLLMPLLAGHEGAHPPLGKGRSSRPGIWAAVGLRRAVMERVAAGPRFGPRKVRPKALVLGAAVALVTVAGVPPAGAGTIVGRVSVQQKDGRPLTSVEGVLVFVDGVRAAMAAAHVTVEMKDKAFVPHLVAIPVGSTVSFPNVDRIYHNVFSVSGPNRFDLELYRRPQSRSASFDFPGIVRVFCNIHPQMNAIVIVRDNPHFAWTRPDGSFSLAGVPAGRYTLKAWYERAGETSTEVIVPSDGEVRANLALDTSRYRPAPHKNKFGRDYTPDEHY
jgi:plastocyanin